MNHERRTPTWLLRDLPALMGLAACFAMFVWPFIIEGFRVDRGHKPREDRMDRIAHLLLNAEATLAFALWREAYRRLGFNHRLVRIELADLPTTRRDLLDRIRAYLAQFQNLSRAAAHYTELLRQRWGQAVHVAHGSTGARLRRAAYHEAAGVVASSGLRSAIALMVSSAQSARPSNHEGVLAHARGPPCLHVCKTRPQHLRSPRLLGPHPHVRPPPVLPVLRGGTARHHRPSKQGKLVRQGSSPFMGRTGGGLQFSKSCPARTNKNPGRTNLPGFLQL